MGRKETPAYSRSIDTTIVKQNIEMVIKIKLNDLKVKKKKMFKTQKKDIMFK